MENIIQLLSDRLSTINETQTVFMVFYAIVWGAIANVQPKWKAFQWPLFFVDLQVTLRIFIAFTVFNVLPLLFFGWTLMCLGSNQYHILRWNIDSAFSVVLHGVALHLPILVFTDYGSESLNLYRHGAIVSGLIRFRITTPGANQQLLASGIQRLHILTKKISR